MRSNGRPWIRFVPDERPEHGTGRRSTPLQQSRQGAAGDWSVQQEPRAVLPITPTTTFSADALQGACERLRTGDGLHQLLARFGGDEARDCRLPRPAHLTSPGFWRRHRASLAIMALYALLAVVPGLLISVFGEHLTTSEFVKLTDWQELPGALFLYLVLAPVLWTFYLWQPRLIVDVFAGLAESGAIGPPRQPGIADDAVLQRLGGRLSRSSRGFGAVPLSGGAILAALATATALATLAVWPPTAMPPFDQFIPAGELYWWGVVPLYFWVLWLPLVFVNVYMLVWIVIRQTIMIANIQRLLHLFAVEPIPFHPDRCSGFAPIGSYAINIVRVALIIGGWALVLLLSGLVTGHGLYVAPHTLSLVLLQVLLTPYLLLGPVWYAHRVMRDAQDRALQRVADQARDRLLGAGDAASPFTQDLTFRELEAQYRLTEEGYHTWPFGRTAFSGVSITAGLTLIANIAAILYRVYWMP